MMRTHKPGKGLRLATSSKRSVPVDDPAVRVYMRQCGEVARLSAQDEIALATELAALRRAVWREIWSDLAATDLVVCAILSKVAEDDVPLFEALQAAASVLRKHPRVRNRPAHEAARERVLALPYFDEDLRVASTVVDDLVRLGRGEPTQLLVRRVVDPQSKTRVALALGARSLLATYRRVLDRFVRANLLLVVSVAQRFAWSGAQFLDLVQEGNIGLLRAVIRFDPARKLRFSTYATWWIRHMIHRSIDEKEHLVRIPTHTAAMIRKLSVCEGKLQGQLHRQPTLTEIASSSGVAEDDVRDLAKVAARSVTSLDVPDSAGVATVGSIPDPGLAPDESMHRKELEQLLVASLDTLGPKLRRIVHDHFGVGVGGEEKTLTQIGREHACSREWIRQQQVSAMRQLRARIERAFSYEEPLSGPGRTSAAPSSSFASVPSS